MFYVQVYYTTTYCGQSRDVCIDFLYFVFFAVDNYNSKIYYILEENERLIVGDDMLSFWQPIIFHTPYEHENIEIYACSDQHSGSCDFVPKRWDNFAKLLEKDNAYVIFAGDQMENATKTSKSNSYTQAMRPSEQKVWWIDHLKPYKDKIICIVDGNHEYNRTTREVDMYPLYDIACALGIEERYRSEAAFVDIGVGKRDNKSTPRQFQYVGYVVHKAHNIVNYGTADAIENIDFLISGHTHKPNDKPLGKIGFDATNKVVYERTVENIVCGSYLRYADYAIRNGMRPCSSKQYKLILDGKKKSIETVGFHLN